ncbi:MAG: FAD-binding oxidoreductase [Pseudomonadota bacterium]
MFVNEDLLTNNSYYVASASRSVSYPMLEGVEHADVCVVGGGFAGLSTALELAARGYSVIVLEAKQVGWGASGRNGGQASVGYADEDVILKQLGADDAKRAWDISVEGMQLLRDRIHQYGIDCSFVPGLLTLAIKKRKVPQLQAGFEHAQHAFDYRHLTWISPEEIGSWIDSKRFCAGVYDAYSGHLHPLKYCLGLAEAAARQGVRIYENSSVVAIEKGTEPRVKTKGGEVRCKFVVLAGNVYLDSLMPKLQPRIMPIGSYIVATNPLAPERADRLIRNRAAAFDTNFVLSYFRVTSDHRLLFGGRTNYSATTPINFAESMRKRMLEVFPNLSDTTIEYAWGGFVDLTMNRAPDFGRVGKNIYYLQGFCGHGVSLAGMAGKLVAEAIAGQAERFDLFTRLRHKPFPGGQLMRAPALALGMLFYRMRDLM